MPEFRDLVERSLERELAMRRELRPHAQLAIAANAPPSVIEEAYRRLHKRYDASAFAEYGPSAVAAAQNIADLLRTAYEAMRHGERSGAAPATAPPRPRPDETCRALETLRGAIERRVAEARAHRAAGRLQDAARVFEAVLVLDRHHQPAREALRELRAALEPKRPSTFSRMFGRLFRRRATDGAAGAVGG